MGCLSFLFPPRLGSAELVVIQPNSAQTGRRIAIKFIVRSYKLSKQNIYAEQSIPGLPGAPLQFLRGQPKLLSMVMYFDARNENRDVRELTNDVTSLMKVDRATHTPRCCGSSGKDFRCSVFRKARPRRSFRSFQTDDLPAPRCTPPSRK